MHKIGEIWVDYGSGCFVWVILIIIAAVIAPVVGLIAGGFWLWNAGENLIGYGTINQEVADARAAATAVASKAQATAIALAPVETDARYYTHLAERAKISMGAVSNFGFDENRDVIYFNIDFMNGDDQPHTIDVRFKVPVNGSCPNVGTSDRNLRLQPGHNTVKIIGDHLFAYMCRPKSGWNTSNLESRIILIDGFPLQDPRESLSKFTVELSPGEQPGQCFIKVTNTDTLPHNVAGYVGFSYTYTKLGVMTEESRTTELGGRYEVKQGPAVNPGQSVVLWHYEFGSRIGTGNLSDFFPANLFSITVNHVVLQPYDPGTESIHPSIKKKTFYERNIFSAPSVCDYKK